MNADVGSIVLCAQYVLSTFLFSRHLLGASAMDLCDSLSPRAVELEVHRVC